MTIICKTFGKEADDEDYPCSMCSCGADDGSKDTKETDGDCGKCGWPGCTHPECPVNGCIDRSEDKCMRDDNFESECEGICGCPYIETRAANHPGAEQTKQTGSAVPVNTAKALALAAMGA